MRVFLSLVTLQAVGSAAASMQFQGEAVETVIVGATEDTYLWGATLAGHSELRKNFGRSQHVKVGGADDIGPYRALVHIPLDGVSRLGKLLSAKLEMSIFMVSLNHIRCTSEVQIGGCATAHVVQSPWGEGTHINANATEGEASWVYSSFPTEWDSPGGDFDANPIGRRSFESEVKQDGVVYDTLKLKAEFPLDVNRMNQILEGETPYFGFLLKDDKDKGDILFESRECKGKNQYGRCTNQMAPRLVLVFEGSSTYHEIAVTGSRDKHNTMAGSIASVVTLALLGFLLIWRRRIRREEYEVSKFPLVSTKMQDFEMVTTKEGITDSQANTIEGVAIDVSRYFDDQDSVSYQYMNAIQGSMS